MIKTNHKFIESSAAERKQWADVIGKLCADGYKIYAMSEATGKSREFIRRVMADNGYKLAIEIKAKPKPAEPTQQDKTVLCYEGSGTHLNRVSIQRPPWGEIEPTDRSETAPRGSSRMFTSPVTQAEQNERELWQETGV